MAAWSATYERQNVTSELVIRETSLGDIAQVLALYSQAFPREELRPVVSALLKEGAKVLSLAVSNGEALMEWTHPP